MLVREKVRVAPYTRLARIYDFVMSHVDYQGWAEYIQKIDHNFEMNVQSILDISCGTGSLCYELEMLGYSTLGFDYNVEMVRTGLEKKQNESVTQLWVADMVYPSIAVAPDMMVSVYDSMNYLLTDEAWQTCLLNVYNCLNTGGCFVFDVSTLGNSRMVFSRYSIKEKNENASYRRNSRYDKKNAIQKNDFEIRFKSDGKTVYCEQHRQKIRSLDKVNAMISQTRFDVIGCFHNFTLEQGSDMSERVHFVLRK